MTLFSRLGVSSDMAAPSCWPGCVWPPPVQPDSGPPALPNCAKDSVRHPRGRHRMAFDQDLAASVRTALVDASAIREVKMFGGIGLLLNGNLVAAVSKRGLLVRVGKDHRGNALAQQGARPMVMRGRTMEGYIYVDPSALNDQAVQKWLQLAVAFVQTLPPRPDRGRSGR